MTVRLQFENSSEIGAFALLTNSYCLYAISGSRDGHGARRHAEGELGDQIPVVDTSIGGCRIIGRLTVGNSRGLLVPTMITDLEFQHLRDSLPDSVAVARSDERLSALGNVIACNDSVALVHPEIQQDTEELIGDVLGVEVFRHAVGPALMVGSHCRMNNNGMLVHPKLCTNEQEELASLLQLPVCSGTVNRGSDVIGNGLVVNDWLALAGVTTTAPEVATIEKIFGLDMVGPSCHFQALRKALYVA